MSAPARAPEQPRRAWAYGLAAVAAAIAIHLPATRHGFIWDDPLVLEQIRHIHGLADLLSPPAEIPHFYYRPLIFATFLVDHALGGDSPFWFHLTVVLWHGLTTGLVFLLGRRLFGDAEPLAAGSAALLFAALPIHVESVAWIAGRSDVIAAAFTTAAVLAASRTERVWTAWLAGALALAGLLAKEVALAALILVPARDLLVDRRAHWRRYVPLGLSLAVYLAMRRAGLGVVVTGEPAAAAGGDVLESLLAALGWYAAKLVLPWSLDPYVPAVPASPAYVLAGAAAALLAVGLLTWAIVAKRGVPAFAILWIGATLAPSLLVIVRRSASAVLAERYLYLPSIGAVLAVGWAVGRLRTSEARRAAAAACVVIALVGAVASAARGGVWADDLSFWSYVASAVPHAAMRRRELATALIARERFDEAERELGAALDLPGAEEQVMTYNNLGNLQVRRGDLDAAEHSFQSGLDLRPHANLLNGLGRIAMKRAEAAQRAADSEETMRQVRRARGFLERAVALDPRDYKSQALLGQVLFNLGERDAAREHLEAALAIEPSGPIAESARRFLQKAQ